jgi:hypothetical protein
MYKLFAAAQAIEFSVGCHARCSNFVVKSKEFPFASTPGLSAPVMDFPTRKMTNLGNATVNSRLRGQEKLLSNNLNGCKPERTGIIFYFFLEISNDNLV